MGGRGSVWGRSEDFINSNSHIWRRMQHIEMEGRVKGSHRQLHSTEPGVQDRRAQRPEDKAGNTGLHPSFSFFKKKWKQETKGKIKQKAEPSCLNLLVRLPAIRRPNGEKKEVTEMNM